MSPELFITIRHFKSKKRNIFISLLTAISVLGVLIASAALIVVNSVVGGFEEEIKNKIINNEPHILIYPKSDIMEDEEFYKLIKVLSPLKDINTVTPIVSSTVLISSDDNISAVKLTGMEPRTAKKSYGIFRNLLAGSLDYIKNPDKAYTDLKKRMNGFFIENRKIELKTVKTEKERKELEKEIENLEKQIITPPKRKLDCIFIGKALASSLRIGVGNSLKLITPFGDIGPAGLMPKTRKFRICGLFFTSLYDFDLNNIYTTVKTAKKFLGITNISAIEIKVKDIYKIDSTINKVKKLINDKKFKISGFSKMNKNLFSALKTEKKGMFLLLFLILLVSSFNIIATLTLIVNSRKKEISILRAIGYTGNQIRKIYIYRGGIIGILGTIPGGFIAIGILQWLKNSYVMNQEIYYIKQLPVKENFFEFFLIIFITFTITLLASVIPASKAAKISPVFGLKGD